MTQTPSTPAPEGLFLLGTDGKMYTVSDETGLSEVGDDMVADGFGISKANFTGELPEAEEAPDVQGHHRICGGWHRYWDYGWIYSFDHCNWIYAEHYHPYGSSYCIFVY